MACHVCPASFMNKHFDSFRKFEHDGWERVADKYEAVWSSLTKRFVVPLLDAVKVGPGMNILDVACGPGYVASAAAQRGATATGLDFSSRMVHQARKLYPAIRFVEGDAEKLPFAGNSFERIVINFGVLHLAHPQKAFAEGHRVLRDNGLIGFTVWAEPEKNPGAKIVEDAITAHADTSVNLPEGPPYFLFCDKGACAQVLGQAGFSAATHQTVTVEWTLPDENYLFEAERHAGVRTAALLSLQSQERLAAIKKAIARGVASYKTRGGYAVPMAAHVITAKAI